MNRRTLLVSTGTLATAALAGCVGGDDDDTTDNEVNSTGNNSGNSNKSETRTITVGDSGEADAEPDMAVFRTSVEERGESAESVRDRLSERSDQLYDALLAYGLDEDAVTTGEFDIRQRRDYRRFEEEYGRPPESEDELEEYTYYQGSHSFTVEVDVADEVGDVIDTAVDAGADDIGRIRFTLSDAKEAQLRKQALEKALESANAEAEFIASEVDATVIEAMTIDTTGSSISPVRVTYDMEDKADADDVPATELHPDDVTVSAEIKVTYRIK